MAAVVDEAAVLELLDGRARRRCRRAAGERRAPAAGVDHEVGAHLVAVLGDHADDVAARRRPGRRRSSRPFTADAAAHGRRPAYAAVTAATAASTTGRRPVSASKRSSPSRRPPRQLDRDPHERVVSAARRPRRAPSTTVGQLGLDDLAEARRGSSGACGTGSRHVVPRRPTPPPRRPEEARDRARAPDAVAVGREQHRRAWPVRPPPMITISAIVRASRRGAASPKRRE